MEKGYIKTSDKAYLYYEIYGTGDETLLFVPGHMCTTKFFKKNADYFKDKYKVVLMDNRGFGNSSKPLHGNDVERNADDIHEIIEQLDLRNVTLLGWSLSGSIVMTYAHKYKCDRLNALGLIDCCLFPFSPAPWNTYNSRDYNMDDWNKKYMLWHVDIHQYVENFVNRVKPGLSEEEQQMVRDEIMKMPPWIGFALHSDWCHTDASQYLSELTVPTIIFSGESKGHGYAMGRYYKTQIQTYCELHEFTTGGHMMFYIESEMFNKYLEDFLNKIRK